jgi:carboxypeptidase T
MKTWKIRPAAVAAATLLSGLASALLMSPALAHGPGKALPGHAGTADTPAAIIEALEAEKAHDAIWKAYFPDAATGRKAAISFHAQLLESHWDKGYLVLELDSEEMDRLRVFGFRFERATEFIEARNRRLTMLQTLQAQRGPGIAEPTSIPGYSCYETVEETFTAGDALIAARPELASWVDAGDSWLKTQGAGGYDLRVLKLTNSTRPAPEGQAKPKLFINAAIHAREYTTAPLVLQFARDLVNGHGEDADATWILDHHEVHLMLHANPDGRKRAETGLSWRKNVNNNFCAGSNNRGVDLNRNFTFQWNSTSGAGSSGSQCSLTYRGPSAGSETETQAVEAYIRSLWPDRRGPGVNDAAPADTSGIHLDIHSFSQLVLWPWGATSAPAPNGAALQTLGRKFAFFNGYQPTQSIGLYPTDGTSDGPSYGELGVAAYTFELGTSFFQSCSVYETAVKPGNLPALRYAAKVVRTPYLTPAGPDITALAIATAPVPAGSPAALTATASDARFNNTNGSEAVQAIAGAEYSVGLAPWEDGAVMKPLAAADGSFNSVTEAVSGSIDTTGLAPGRHLVYVRARDASGAVGAVTAGWVTVVALSEVGETEPNNVLTSAQVLPALPLRVNAELPWVRGLPRDIDWFRFSVGAGRTATLTMMPGATANYALDVFNASRVRIVTGSDGGIGGADVAVFTNTGAAAATYYVRVSAQRQPGANVTGPYRLDLVTD